MLTEIYMYIYASVRSSHREAYVCKASEIDNRLSHSLRREAQIQEQKNAEKLPVKAALAVGKNHNVLLMIMRAFPPSAATASSGSSGFGCGLGSGNQSKNRRSYLKLILCCLFAN